MVPTSGEADIRAAAATAAAKAIFIMGWFLCFFGGYRQTTGRKYEKFQDSWIT
jgi:hypothetical protein